MAPGFDGGASRFKSYHTPVPAPGTYEPRDVNKALKPITVTMSAFGAKEERLRGPEKFTPGPGAYQNADGWNKKSFNISLDDTGLI